jgi:hypothetical protein
MVRAQKTTQRAGDDGDVGVEMGAFLADSYVSSIAKINGIFRWLTAAAANPVLEDMRQRAERLEHALRLAKKAAAKEREEELANEMLGRQCVAAALPT